MHIAGVALAQEATDEIKDLIAGKDYVKLRLWNSSNGTKEIHNSSELENALEKIGRFKLAEIEQPSNNVETGKIARLYFYIQGNNLPIITIYINDDHIVLVDDRPTKAIITHYKPEDLNGDLVVTLQNAATAPEPTLTPTPTPTPSSTPSTIITHSYRDSSNGFVLFGGTLERMVQRNDFHKRKGVVPFAAYPEGNIDTE